MLAELIPLFKKADPFDEINYLAGPYYTGPKLTPAPLTPALIGVIFQMFTVKLS